MSLEPLLSYPKSPLTDICLVSSDGTELWYSKYQLARISPMLRATLEDPTAVTIVMPFDTTTICGMLEYIDTDSISGKGISS